MEQILDGIVGFFHDAVAFTINVGHILLMAIEGIPAIFSYFSRMVSVIPGYLASLTSSGYGWAVFAASAIFLSVAGSLVMFVVSFLFKKATGSGSK